MKPQKLCEEQIHKSMKKQSLKDCRHNTKNSNMYPSEVTERGKTEMEKEGT